MTTCEMDTGTALGNRPLCSRPAQYAVTYRNGTYGPFTVRVCAGHVDATRGRAYPCETAVTPL